MKENWWQQSAEDHFRDWYQTDKPEGDRHLVFVYGTLRKTFGNNGYFNNATSEFKGYMTIKGYQLYSTGGGGVPMVLQVDNEEDTAYGEVYEISSNTLHNLDLLEGHPYGWKRRRVKEDPNIWVYTAPTEKSVQYMIHVPHGDWKKHVEEVRPNRFQYLQ